MNFIINEHNSRLILLNKFLYSMNLIASASKNSLMHFAEKLLQQLEKEAEYDKLKAIIEWELCVSYGLSLDEFNSEKITHDVFDWWENL